MREPYGPYKLNFFLYFDAVNYVFAPNKAECLIASETERFPDAVFSVVKKSGVVGNERVRVPGLPYTSFSVKDDVESWLNSSKYFFNLINDSDLLYFMEMLMSSIEIRGKQIFLDTSVLAFDPKNPRFPVSLAESADSVIVDRMIRDERIAELMQSIGLQNYFMGEPLLVTDEGAPEGKYIVVEGNRRLAALKVLNGDLSPSRNLKTITSIIYDSPEKPREIPCIYFEKREQILRYLGFRHITGIKSWGPLAKARYLKELRDVLYEGYSHSEQLKMLAREIGSRPDYVGTMLSGLALYDLAEERDFFNLSGINPKHIEFTLLTTAISYKNIASFVGLESKVDTDLNSVDMNHVKDLFSWLYAQDQQGDTIVPDSRKLKHLSAIVANPEAVQALRSKQDLEAAFLMSEGPHIAYNKLLNDAYRRLRLAHENLAELPSVEEHHFTTANNIFELSRNIKNSIRGRLDDE